MDERPYNVLFLCTGNSARSILAEALIAQTGPIAPNRNKILLHRRRPVPTDGMDPGLRREDQKLKKTGVFSYRGQRSSAAEGRYGAALRLELR